MSQAVYPTLSTPNGELRTVKLGTIYDPIERTDDPDKYKFMVLLTSKGAAINNVILSEFKERSDTEETGEALSAEGDSAAKVLKPLTLLSPWTMRRHGYLYAGEYAVVAGSG